MVQSMNDTHQYKIGSKVILGKHQNVPGVGTNWCSDMERFVGKEATITHLNAVEHRANIPLYLVDLDRGAYVWREVNMTPIGSPASTSTTSGSKCKKCGEFNPYVPTSNTFVCYGCSH